jgi:hypothetical protein
MSRAGSPEAMNGSMVRTPLFSNGARDLSLEMVAKEVEVAGRRHSSATAHAGPAHRRQRDRDADLTPAQ